MGWPGGNTASHLIGMGDLRETVNCLPTSVTLDFQLDTSPL